VVSAIGTLGELAHHLRGGGDFADGFLLHAQAHGEGGDHDRRHLAAHDLAQQVQHFVVEDLAVFDAAQQRFLRVIGMSCLWGWSARRVALVRKFFSRAWPCSDRMDSGWNCTPSMSSSCGARP
jgi:hypothetical protein